MTTEPQLIRSQRYHEIGGLIERDAGLLVERWRQRAVAVEKSAHQVHQEALLDHLPAFLLELGRNLADSDVSDNGVHCRPARQHGAQRWEVGWSLPDVVRDYQILRLVILEYLEEALDRPLRQHEVLAVGLALDDAITASVVMYVNHREDRVRQIERERAEEARRAAANLRKWQQVFQQAGWGVAILDAVHHTFEAVNPAFARMHGYAVQDLAGRPLAEVLAPECRGELPDHAVKTQAQGHHTFEAVHLRRDGSRFPVLTDATVCKDEAGTVLYQIASFQDITERKRLEESLQQHAAALQKAQQRKDEFLAVLAHELRNFLAPARNAVELLRHFQRPDSPLREATEVLERQTRQMGRVVDDLLDVARIARGQVVLRKEPVELGAVLVQAVQSSEPLITERHHQLEITRPPEPLWVEADAARLVQILTNVLNNAAKYTAPRGHIYLTLERAGGLAVLRVRDTGRGISPEALGRIFDPFLQLEPSADRSNGGLGIGLALVRRLVELHGGTVTASSAGPGQGSEFVVRLPALAQAPSAPPSAADRPPTSNNSRRILLVEDNADGRTTLQALLRLWGHHVEAAADGPQGVELGLANRPEVALIDLGLPTLDGYQVAQQLRTRLGKGVCLIALTGYGQEEDRRRTLEAGFDAHLVKPVNPEELSQLLADLPLAPP